MFQIMKCFTMGVAITAMIIGQYLAGVAMSIIEIIMFPIFSLIIFFKGEGNILGYEFSNKIPVIFEDFEVVYRR